MVKECIICRNRYKRYGKQALIAKYCSTKCMGKDNIKPNNATCSYCNIKFKIRSFKLKINKNVFCSKECYSKSLLKMITINEGYYYIHKPNHPYCNSKNKVRLHRYEVEKYYNLFNFKYFEKINKVIVLRKSTHVHHIDEDISNNHIGNLVPLTDVEHMKLHGINKTIIRDIKGRILTIIKN